MLRLSETSCHGKEVRGKRVNSRENKRYLHVASHCRSESRQSRIPGLAIGSVQVDSTIQALVPFIVMVLVKQPFRHLRNADRSYGVCRGASEFTEFPRSMPSRSGRSASGSLNLEPRCTHCASTPIFVLCCLCLLCQRRPLPITWLIDLGAWDSRLSDRPHDPRPS